MLRKIKGEFRTISFPTWKETMKNTGFVLITAIISSIILSLIQTGITELIHLFL